jgi:methylmalonyl-CoA/ethylmalonyl-CoA epimerase
MAPTDVNFGLGPIGQIALTVTDTERAIEFYRDKLGMRFLFQFPGLAFFDCGGVRLMLSNPDRPNEETISGSVIYFKVADIQVAAHALASRGVIFEQEPHLIARLPDHDLWMAFFRDPDRNLLALMCEVRAS